LEINKIIEKMSYYLNEAKFVEGKTVIILDEVQECDNAYGSLRFFYEDKRFDVVATGSLLGLKSMNFTPLGSVTYLNMHSLDFEEFL
jgi:predicted AAA+ superfamily ATPase